MLKIAPYAERKTLYKIMAIEKPPFPKPLDVRKILGCKRKK